MDTTTARRLARAARLDSHLATVLSDAAAADLEARGLFSRETWTLTPAGRAAFAAVVDTASAADTEQASPFAPATLTPRRVTVTLEQHHDATGRPAGRVAVIRDQDGKWLDQYATGTMATRAASLMRWGRSPRDVRRLLMSR